MRFNPPPGWPVPTNWQPSAEWRPDPEWPPAPTGWRYWVSDHEVTSGHADARAAEKDGRGLEGVPAVGRTTRRGSLVAVVAIVIVVCGVAALIVQQTRLFHQSGVPVATEPLTFIIHPTPATGSLTAPVLLSPQNGSVFSNYPRNTDVSWEPVEGATGYRVRVQFYDGNWHDLPGESNPILASDTTYHFEFVGAQLGRWCVSAVGLDGENGPASAWHTFEYTQ